MAKYRHVHVEFWQDPKVLEEMTPEDKYFYLYLLTNPSTTQIGVYKITRKQMAFDIGYSIESVNSLLERFINVHKLIKYNEKTRELAIVNWGKYNLNKSGKPVLDCIKKELSDVKDKTLLWEILNHIPNNLVAAEFSRYVYDTSNDTYHDSATTGGQKEKEKEKEKKDNAQLAQSYSNEFERFWILYPRRIDKKKAFRSFKLVAKHHPIETILAGTEKYAQQVQNTEKKFIKHPATFLNNESFIDGYEETEQQVPQVKPREETKGALSGFWSDDD